MENDVLVVFFDPGSLVCQPLVEFPGTEPLIELATANGNEVLMSILSQEPDLPAEKQTLRVRYLRSAKTSEAEVNLNAVGLPEIGIQSPELQFSAKGSTNKPVKVTIRGGGFGNNPDNVCAVIQVSGGQAVLSPFALAPTRCRIPRGRTTRTCART